MFLSFIISESVPGSCLFRKFLAVEQLICFLDQFGCGVVPDIPCHTIRAYQVRIYIEAFGFLVVAIGVFHECDLYPGVSIEDAYLIADPDKELMVLFVEDQFCRADAVFGYVMPADKFTCLAVVKEEAVVSDNIKDVIPEDRIETVFAVTADSVQFLE